MTIEPQSLYSPKQAAAILNCADQTLYNLLKTGELRHIRVGARKGYRIQGSDLQEFIDSRKSGGPRPKMPLTLLGL